MARLFDDHEAVRTIFGKVILLVLLTLFCTAVLLSVANDMYAFFKPAGEVHLRLDSPCTLSSFSRTLEEQGVLLNPHVFSLYVKNKEKEALIEDFSGELSLDRSMSYREILHALSEQNKNP